MELIAKQHPKERWPELEVLRASLSPRRRLLLWFLLAVVALGVVNLVFRPPVPRLSAQEKLEDFQYLFGLLRDNHPFLPGKARVESYDWVAHEAEFAQMVARTRNNREFARAVHQMLLLVNDGHTGLVNGDLLGLYQRLSVSELEKTAGKPPPGLERFYSQLSFLKNISHQARPEIASYWTTLANTRPGQYSLPFTAVYNGGRYYVIKVAPDEAIRERVSDGLEVVAVGGVPVHDYVASTRGSTILPYDPVTKRLYMPVLLLPTAQDPIRVRFRDASGTVFERSVPWSKTSWDAHYRRMPLDFSIKSIFTAIIGHGQVGYIYLPQMYTDLQDMAPIRDFLPLLRKLPALIIDIRGNGGGSDLFWHHLVALLITEPISFEYAIMTRSGQYVRDYLGDYHLAIDRVLDRSQLGPGLTKSMPPELLTPAFSDPQLVAVTLEPSPDSIHYTGRIFVLVDDRVSSSADAFAGFCRYTEWATVVGSYTGGEGPGITPVLAVLPNSGLVFRFPVTLALTPWWTAWHETRTMPDVPVELTVEDIIRQQSLSPSLHPDHDPVLREALRLAVGSG
ncbi:MAG: S41 family peptidase [Bacillota bacterium]